MIYSIDSPYMPYLIDEYRTGYTEDEDRIECVSCGSQIRYGNSYYDVHGRIYCRGCAGEADEAILDAVRDSFIYEL